MKEITFMYNSEQSEKIFGQHQYKLSESIRRIKKIVEDNISIEINADDKLKTNRAIAKEMINKFKELNEGDFMNDYILKTQAALNYYFKNIAKFVNDGTMNLERLECDGILGPKTKDRISVFNDCQKETILNNPKKEVWQHCGQNYDFDYTSQRDSKLPNQLCSVASMCMILNGYCFDITVDELNNYIDNSAEIKAKAIELGFKKYVEAEKTEQITAIMVFVLNKFIGSEKFKMGYLNENELIDIMHRNPIVPAKRRIIFATGLTGSGHYVVGNFIFPKFGNRSKYEISIFDPFGDWFKKYKNTDGKIFFEFDEFFALCKTDGFENKVRCIYNADSLR